MSGGRVTARVNDASLRRMQARIDEANERIHAATRAAVTITAELAALVETQRVPVDTGALRKGIKVKYSAGGLRARIGIFDPDLYYAVFVEWGTTARPPMPFAVPAAERARAEFAENTRAQMARVV